MLDLLFKDQRFGAIANITIDATVVEQHVQSARVTDHLVEKGSNIADHVRPDPIQITLTGYISNQPIIDVWNYNPFNKEQGILQKVGAAFNIPGDLTSTGEAKDDTADGASMIPFVPGVAFTIPSMAFASGPADVIANLSTATTFTFDKGFDRPANAFEEFLKIIQEGKEVSIATSLREYDHMIIESFTVDRDASTGESLFFTASAREIKIVETNVRRVATPKLPAAVSPKNTGGGPPSESNAGSTGSGRTGASDSAANGMFGLRRGG